MPRSEADKQRIREEIRNCDALIQELRRQTDRSSKEELRRQMQRKANLEYELHHG